MRAYIKGMVQYIRDVEVEFWKISWPARGDAVKSTVVVLFVSAVFTVVLAIADYLFSKMIGFILS